MRTNKSIFRALAVLPLVGVLSFTGCSGVLPATLQRSWRPQTTRKTTLRRRCCIRTRRVNWRPKPFSMRPKPRTLAPPWTLRGLRVLH